MDGEAWRVARFGKKVTFEEVHRQIGKGGDQLMPVFLSLKELAKFGEDLEQFRGDLCKKEFLPRVNAFPGVRQLFPLSALHTVSAMAWESFSASASRHWSQAGSDNTRFLSVKGRKPNAKTSASNRLPKRLVSLATKGPKQGRTVRGNSLHPNGDAPNEQGQRTLDQHRRLTVHLPLSSLFGYSSNWRTRVWTDQSWKPAGKCLMPRVAQALPSLRNGYRQHVTFLALCARHNVALPRPNLQMSPAVRRLPHYERRVN